MIIGPYTITRGSIIPYDEFAESAQDVRIAADGAIVVQESFVAKFIIAKLRVPRDEGEIIKGYIESGVRFSSIPFYITDDFGTQWLVRYWGKKITMKNYAPGMVEINLKLRVEV